MARKNLGAADWAPEKIFGAQFSTNKFSGAQFAGAQSVGAFLPQKIARAHRSPALTGANQRHK